MTGEWQYQLKRVGRHLLWPHPLLYWPIGMARHGKTGNVFERQPDVYISGYPRSGNSFSVKAFLLANPGVALRSHRHIPTFVLVSARRGTPGMVLLRHPLDAAVSWAIYQDKPLHRALQYYGDYYSVLRPHRDRLFMVRFEDVVSDFSQVTRAFNTRWGTAYKSLPPTPENMALCFSQLEEDWRGADGLIPESRVPRPSPERNARKQALLAEAETSLRVQEALRRAQDIYGFLSAAAHRNGGSPPKPVSPHELSKS